MPEKLDKSSRIPLPQQLKAILRKRIETGHYKPGERIDAVRKLAEEFTVSSLTVQKACKLLERKIALSLCLRAVCLFRKTSLSVQPEP